MAVIKGLEVASIGGVCPTQAEGEMHGNPFYFRARHGEWTLTVVKPGCDPVMYDNDNSDDVLLYRNGYDITHGWMEKDDVMVILESGLRELGEKK